MASRPQPRPTKRSKAPARPFVRGLDDTQQLLLSAARDLFLEVGEGGFSLREVARRVGVSPAAVYRHFEGKEALIFAACTQGFQVFSSYLVRALQAPSPLARLLVAAEQYRAFALENPLDYRFIFMSPASPVRPPSALKAADTAPALPQSTTFQFLIDRVSECMNVGVLASSDALKTSLLIWAHLHGLVALRLCSQLDPLGDDLAFAEFYRDSFARLLRGLSV